MIKKHWFIDHIKVKLKKSHVQTMIFTCKINIRWVIKWSVMAPNVTNTIKQPVIFCLVFIGIGWKGNSFKSYGLNKGKFVLFSILLTPSKYASHWTSKDINKKMSFEYRYFNTDSDKFYSWEEKLFSSFVITTTLHSRCMNYDYLQMDCLWELSLPYCMHK